MSSYATVQDAIDLYGQDYIVVSADRNEDGVVDMVPFTDALAQATSELNSYIGVKYKLPLAEVPDVLRRFCVDIAVYITSSSPGVLTEEKENRYKSAIDWAKSVAKGTATLGIEDTPESIDSIEGGSVQTSYSTREMTRGKLGRLF